MKSEISQHFPNRVQKIHIDGQEEYKFADTKVGACHTSTAPYTLEHNSFAERCKRAIFDPFITLLDEAGISAC